MNSIAAITKLKSRRKTWAVQISSQKAERKRILEQMKSDFGETHDLEHYRDDALRKRRLMREDPRIVASISRWWVDVDGDMTPFDKFRYVKMLTCILPGLMDNEDDIIAASDGIGDEWEKDANGKSKSSFSRPGTR